MQLQGLKEVRIILCEKRKCETVAKTVISTFRPPPKSTSIDARVANLFDSIKYGFPLPLKPPSILRSRKRRIAGVHNQRMYVSDRVLDIRVVFT